MRLFTTFVFLMFMGCQETSKEYYEGYIYDKKIPLNNVIVIEDGMKLNSTISNEKGYFKLKMSSKNFIRDLIFIKEGYRTDTVSLVRGQHSGSLYTLFLREESDTLQMNSE